MELWEREKYTAIAVILGVLLTVGAIFYFKGGIPFTISSPFNSFVATLSSTCGYRIASQAEMVSQCWMFPTPEPYSSTSNWGATSECYALRCYSPDVRSQVGTWGSVDTTTNWCGQKPYWCIPKEPPSFNITVYFYSSSGLDTQVGSLAGLFYKGTSNYVICPYQTDCGGYCCDGDLLHKFPEGVGPYLYDGHPLIDLRGVPDGEYDLYLHREWDKFYSTHFPITIQQGKSVHIDWYFVEDIVCIDGICPIQPPSEEQVDALIRMLIQQIIQQICNEKPRWCSPNCYISGETFNYNDAMTCCSNLQTLILKGNPPFCEGCTMPNCADKSRICNIGVCGNNICEGYENQCNCQSDCG